jgi:uncharacterized protein (DUF302 family)
MNLTRKLNLSFEDVIEKVKVNLKEEGFGILTEIDVKETLKKKLNVDYPNYKILGACNPQLAKKALDVDKEVGTLLPCNVIIYENDQGVQVSIQRPTEMMKILANQDLNDVAQEAESKLKKAIDHL